jgi:hypothetical protein
MITLFCLVHGEPVGNAFSVKIPPTDTVDDLKKLIKKEKQNKFSNIDADELRLWADSIPIDDATALEELELKHEEALIPTDDIAEVFPESPAKKHIHIIVKAPLGIIFLFAHPS